MMWHGPAVSRFFSEGKSLFYMEVVIRKRTLCVVKHALLSGTFRPELDDSSYDQGTLSRKDVLPMASFKNSVINRFSRSSRLIPPRYFPLSIIS